MNSKDINGIIAYSKQDTEPRIKIIKESNSEAELDFDDEEDLEEGK